MRGDVLPPPTVAVERGEPLPRTVAGRDVVGPDTLFGLSFGSLNRAQQFMLAVNGLAQVRKMRLVDTVLVVKGEVHVRVRETIDPQPGRSALAAAVWMGVVGLIVGGPVGWIVGIVVGAGVGALAAKVIDRGIPDAWVAWFKEAVRPHTATVVVLAGAIDQAALAAEVARFPGVRLVHTTLPAEAFSQLRSAFSDDAPSRSAVTDV